MRRVLVLLHALAALAAPPMLATGPHQPAESSSSRIAGSGWVVWESNRTGAFRIWRRALGGGPEKQLSADEPGRDHCCAHLSPDGARLVYLSMPDSQGSYAAPETVGELRLVGVAGGAHRVLVAAARNYGGHRAAVWWSEHDLAYIDAAGDTRLLDLTTGAERVIADGPERGEGFLVDPTGRWATSATPTFSALHSATGKVELSATVGGCDAWLAADGTTGIFVAGSGGPVDAIDLPTRRTRTILSKHDPRLPADRGYVYFSILSRDRTLLAVAGSNDEHDHFRADYDVFVVELDPATLDPWSDAERVTAHPAVDRYPDVWRDPATAPRPPPASSPAAPAAPSAEDDGWPATRHGLAWVWRGASDGDPRGNGRRGSGRPSHTARSETLVRSGETSIDPRGRLALAGGWAAAEPGSARRVTAAIKGSNTVTVELVIEPQSLASDAGGAVFALGSGSRQRGILISQNGDSIELRLRTGQAGRGGGAATSLARLPGAGPHHVAFTYSPGRLHTYLDGQLAASPAWTGDFFRLRAEELTLGAETGEPARFRGLLSHVAVFARELTADEIAADASRALGELDG